MAIKFGMTLAEIIQQFVRGFIKQTGRKPSGLDNIKIQQEALQRFKDMNKVVDMKGNPLNPAEGIMGGEQAQNFIRKSDPALYEDRGGNIIPTQFKDTVKKAVDANRESEANILARLNKRNKEGIESFKNKSIIPEDEYVENSRNFDEEILGETYSFGFKKGKEFQLNASSMGKGSLKEIIDSGELVGDDLDFAINVLRDRKADGGRTEYYGGGQAMVGEDLSEIGHGSDALMARNMQIAPGGQATTSTGLNYLLGQDNDTVRVPYAGGGMSKRAFLKLLGAFGAGAAGVKSGILGLGGKKAATEVVKEVATSGSGGVPPYFFKLVEKIKTLGDDAPKLAVKDREKVTTYKDYTLTEDVTTGEKTIQRMKIDDDLKYDASEYYGKPVGEETYMSYRPGKGQIDETTKGKTPIDEYTEDTSLIRSDRPAEGEIMDTFDGVPDDVIEEAMKETIKIGKADGGRIGYGKGKLVKEGIPALIKKIKNKFGDDAITTADKIKTPQKTLDRDMFKKADDRLNNKREMNADELEDFEMEIGADQLEGYDFDGTVGDAKRILKEDKAYEAEMYQQYKMGKLDPEAGDKSPARKRFLEQKLADLEASGDSRLMTREEIEELTFFDLGTEIDKTKLSVNDEIKQGVASIMKDTSPEALEKSIEIDNLMLEYPGMTKDLADQIASSSPTMKADMIAMVEQTFKMDKMGMSGDEIIDTFKNTKRTKQASGGLAAMLGE